MAAAAPGSPPSMSEGKHQGGGGRSGHGGGGGGSSPPGTATAPSWSPTTTRGAAWRGRAAAERLRAGNAALKEEVALEKRWGALPSNPSATAQVVRLQEQADAFTRRIESEKRRVAELDKAISAVQSRILDQRKRMGGVNAARESNAAIAKQVKLLENRLDKALTKYNESVAANRRLRESIDGLRRERLVFDGIHKKLEKELADRKREMAAIIETSNLAYEARDAALQQMAQLKAQAEREQQAFEAEWRELGRLIDHDHRMVVAGGGSNNNSNVANNTNSHNNANSHNNNTTTINNNKGEDSEHKQEGASNNGNGNNNSEEEMRLRKKVIKGNWAIAKDKAAQAVSMEKVQSYGEAFARIQAATGIAEIEELVATFVAAEDQNFSLFNYVNELNVEVEKLEEGIAELRAEIDKYKGQGVSTDNARKKILKELEERLARTEARAEAYEARHQAALRTVAALKQGIAHLFQRIGCNTPHAHDLLGDSGVTDSNLMQYLGIIEQRTNEILQMYASAAFGNTNIDPNNNNNTTISSSNNNMLTSISSSSNNNPTFSPNAAALVSILGQGPHVPAGAPPITINPPSTTNTDGEDIDDNASDAGMDGDNNEDNEDNNNNGGNPRGYNRPLTREELKARALRALGRHDGVGGNSGNVGGGGSAGAGGRSGNAGGNGNNNGNNSNNGRRALDRRNTLASNAANNNAIAYAQGGNSRAPAGVQAAPARTN
eukprot:jgi/Chlat1/5808/Chrsp4S00482